MTTHPPHRSKVKGHQNDVLGVGNTNRQGYKVLKELVASDGNVRKRVLQRPSGGSPYTLQKKINAFNFPFTANPGAGCEFQCIYCYLQQPFFQRHVTLPHGREVNAMPDFAGATGKFLQKKIHLPQYMKRIQWGVSTEMWLPDTVSIWNPEESLKAFQNHGQTTDAPYGYEMSRDPQIQEPPGRNEGEGSGGGQLRNLR